MKIKSILIVASIGMMFAACSSREDVSSDGEQIPVRITAGIKSMETRSSGNPDQLQNSSFLDGAKINVYFESVSFDFINGLPESGYTTYTKTDGNWGTDDDIYITGSDSPIVAFGIYPAKVGDESITKSTTSFTVNAEQDNDADYRSSDLMYAYTRNDNPLSPTSLEFNHCMSKITIKMVPTSEFTEPDLTSKISWVDIYANRKALLSFADNKITVTDTEAVTSDDFVTAGYGNSNICTNGISCIIPPQEISAGSKLIRLLYNIDYTYSYYVPAGGITFEAGKEYIFEITLKNSGVTISAPTVKGWGTGSTVQGDAK